MAETTKEELREWRDIYFRKKDPAWPAPDSLTRLLNDAEKLHELEETLKEVQTLTDVAVDDMQRMLAHAASDCAGLSRETVDLERQIEVLTGRLSLYENPENKN